MAVRIRLTRGGRRHRPYYQVVAIDSRRPREGKPVEFLGSYDPLLADKNIRVDIERVHAWIKQGAQYSESVRTLLARNGYEVYPEGHAERQAAQVAKAKAKRQNRKKKDGSNWQPAKKRALVKHQRKLKQARLAELEKQLEAHRAASAEAEPAAEAEGEASES